MNPNNKKINIWDLGSKINIKVNLSFIDFINDKIKEKYKTKRRIHKELIKYYNLPFLVFKDRMKRGYKHFIDLEILLNLCKLLDISLDQLQDNIIAYKTRKGPNYIENPKLPVKITPIFDMLIAHFIGDGFVINPKRGRKPYFGYRQYDDHYRNLFIRKIESVFGKLNYRSDYFHGEKTTQIYFPVVCSDLMFGLYNLDVNSFKSENARIPREVFNRDFMHKLSFLIGIIVDEGHVDSSLIIIRMKNQKLIGDLAKLCADLGYSTSIKGGKDYMFNLYILSESLRKFYRDYKRLLNKFPEVNLGYKGDKIEEFISKINKPKVYIKGNKPRILGELSKENLTVNELAKILGMTRQGVRYLIKELMKEKRVEIKSTVKFGNYKYGLR